MMEMLTRILKPLASLWLTLALLGWAVLVLAYNRLTGAPVGLVVAVPLAGLCLNLLAALATNYRLRRQIGLLVFHLSLASIALMAAAGRMMSFDGHVEMVEGSAFDPAKVEGVAGPWNDASKLDGIHFVQAGFSVNYLPGMDRTDTISHVILADGTLADVGDDVPLISQGYRFYTTHNKGFAPILTYRGADGQELVGVVNLPSYPLLSDYQTNQWAAPDGSGEAAIWLQMDHVYRENESWTWRLPEDPRLVVIQGDDRWELRPGEEIPFGNGALRFAELRAWMGYKMFYDPTIPWLLAASGIALLGLGWHAFSRFLAEPWDAEAPAAKAESRATDKAASGGRLADAR